MKKSLHIEADQEDDSYHYKHVGEVLHEEQKLHHIRPITHVTPHHHADRHEDRGESTRYQKPMISFVVRGSDLLLHLVARYLVLHRIQITITQLIFRLSLKVRGDPLIPATFSDVRSAYYLNLASGFITFSLLHLSSPRRRAVDARPHSPDAAGHP